MYLHLICHITKARWPRFDSRQGKNFLFFTDSRSALRPTHPPIEWVPWAISPWLKRPVREANHLPPSIAEIKNDGAIPPLPHMLSWHCA
jgi:hypothetical protein